MELRHFNIQDFDSPDEPGSGHKMDCDFLRRIDRARSLSGTSYVINSGYRTPEHNKKAKGKPGSSHLGGFAADIKATTSVKRGKVLKGLILAGFKRIGISKTFIHADSDPTKPECIWLY